MIHLYLNENRHDAPAAFIGTGPRQVYFIRRMKDGLFLIDDVDPADLGELTAAIQCIYGVVARGGDPNHDCTGLPFRGPASVTSTLDDSTGAMYITFRPAGWEFDI